MTKLPMTANDAWILAVDQALKLGSATAPRGQPARELLSQTHCVGLRYPVVTIPSRKLNYQFMVAEALWILSGSDSVEDVAKYNSRMREFSDDGIYLAGAYGPRFVSQLSYVAHALANDRDTRQATMTLWQSNPTPSKDIPCTVALDFKIRDNLLHCQVFMRSSDVWLGLPYDIFSFSMMTYRVLERLVGLGVKDVTPGSLFIVAASSHLYDRDAVKAEAVLSTPSGNFLAAVPERFWNVQVRRRGEHGPQTLSGILAELLENKNLRWW